MVSQYIMERREKKKHITSNNQIGIYGNDITSTTISWMNGLKW